MGHIIVGHIIVTYIARFRERPKCSKLCAFISNSTQIINYM